MKQTIRLSESDLHKIIKNSVIRALNEGCHGKKKSKQIEEDFEQDYNSAMDKKTSSGGLWGMELKNQEGDWEYGDVTYDPSTQTMSCMGVSIDVDPDMTVDQNLEGLYDELMNKGYTAESRNRRR